jgi:hypothetical protein
VAHALRRRHSGLPWAATSTSPGVSNSSTCTRSGRVGVWRAGGDAGGVAPP